MHGLGVPVAYMKGMAMKAPSAFLMVLASTPLGGMEH